MKLELIDSTGLIPSCTMERLKDKLIQRIGDHQVNIVDESDLSQYIWSNARRNSKFCFEDGKVIITLS